LQDFTRLISHENLPHKVSTHAPGPTRCITYHPPPHTVANSYLLNKMFSLLNRATSSSSLHRSRPSNESLPSPTSSQLPTPPPASLEPAIDGPPSPEHIRAYTEQMRRGSAFTNRTRSYTSSSATPSFRSGISEPFFGPGDTPSISRQSSRRSNSSNMPLKKGERPESIQIFGKGLFSRTLRRDSGSRSSSSLSTAPSLVG
jgi:hypothetical protein